MATPGHHQLRPEQPAHGPAGHEHRRGEIEGAAECQLGATPAGEDDAGGYCEEKPPERRQPAVPDGKDVARIVGVVAEVGQDVEGPGAHDGGEDDPEEDGQEPVGRVAVLAQPALEVGVAEPERQREPDAVRVDLQRSDVKDDGDGFHWAPAARLVSVAALAAPRKSEIGAELVRLRQFAPGLTTARLLVGPRAVTAKVASSTHFRILGTGSLRALTTQEERAWRSSWSGVAAWTYSRTPIRTQGHECCLRARPGVGPATGSSDGDLRHHDRRTVRAATCKVPSPPERDSSSTTLDYLL